MGLTCLLQTVVKTRPLCAFSPPFAPHARGHACGVCDISELEVFRMLDRLQPTTTGSDLNGFCALAHESFQRHWPNSSTSPSTVVWYHASGRALSSLLSPRLRTLPIEPSDVRPISITSNIKLTSRTLFYRGPLRDTLSERTSTRLCNNLLHVRGIGLKG